MKMILKTFNNDLEIKYDEKIMSEMNKKVLRQITFRLIDTMHPRYNPIYKQVDKWLAATDRLRV